MDLFQNIDWSNVLDDLIIVACILSVSLIVGIVLNRMLTKKLDAKVEETDSELMVLFFRAMKGVPISLCLVIGLYWSVQTSDLPDSMDKIFSYVLFTVIIFR
ncbi:MAG: hypothetical protein IKP64_11910 [Selenomonadaceae bacterium]|nr:hypothetical protein [Selenomonadaceae bacterium]